MSLSILNNVSSLAAQNQLSMTQASLQKTLLQLSSGSRLNTGADDAAGLAIADGLHANITALTQSARNASDGVGSLQVADGALAQVTALLNRAVTLATEASTGTVSDPQRTTIDAEFTAIKAEIDRIGSSTNYNGGQVFTATATAIYLSDGTTGGSSSITVTTGALSSAAIGFSGTPRTSAGRSDHRYERADRIGSPDDCHRRRGGGSWRTRSGNQPLAERFQRYHQPGAEPDQRRRRHPRR